MALVISESRCKIGIEWYDSEQEAEQRVASVIEEAKKRLAEGYDFGYMGIRRDKAFDRPGLYAVVVP